MYLRHVLSCCQAEVKVTSVRKSITLDHYQGFIDLKYVTLSVFYRYTICLRLFLPSYLKRLIIFFWGGGLPYSLVQYFLFVELFAQVFNFTGICLSYSTIAVLISFIYNKCYHSTAVYICAHGIMVGWLVCSFQSSSN